MTPSVPRGSSPRPTDPSTPASTLRPAAASDRPTVAPLRLSLGTSYTLAGQAGFPLRGDLLVTYRPDRLIGFGLHLDTNFTDHLSATARGEAIWPIHRFFQIHGSIEAGVRAFMNQPFHSEEQEQRLNGALFTFGAELEASVPITDGFGLSLFLSGRYSPGGGLSSGGDVDRPAIGVQAQVGEVLAGLRIDIYPPVGPHHVEADGEAAAPDAETSGDATETSAPTQRQALQDLQESVAALLAGPPSPEPTTAGDASATPDDTGASPTSDTADGDDARTATAVETGPSAADREILEALQREVRSLTDSSAALETELNAATQILDDLSSAHEVVGPQHILLDGFHNTLTARPPSLDLPALTSFLNGFRSLIRDDGAVRLLTSSPTESFGSVITSNFESVRDALQRYQRTLPRRVTAGRTARAELEPALAELGAIIAELQQLTQRPQSTEPPAHQVQLWRTRLERISGHIEELSPRLSAEAMRSLRSNFERLQSSFATLTHTMDEARQTWMTTRALYSHFRDFRNARRPEQAVAALRGMQTELGRAPESYRTERPRNLATLTRVLTPFVRRYSENPVAAWAEARGLAIEVLTWIDPAYRAPAVAERPATTRRRRPPRSTEPVFHFPTSGGATGD